MRSKKGIIIVLIFLIAIPVVADLIISMLLPNRTSMLGMSKQLMIGYATHIPMFVIYLIIAFTVIFLYRKWKKGQIKNHE